MSIAIELQTLIYDTLIADPAVSGFLGDRIYDGRPADAAYPCITFGPSDSVLEEISGVNARTDVLQLDVWDNSGGRLRPCKEIVDAVRNALHLADLSLSINALVRIRVEGMRVFLDRDGTLAHGVITIEADLEEV